MEIYNEELIDLIAEPSITTTTTTKPLKIREQPNAKIFVENAVEKVVGTEEDIYELLKCGIGILLFYYYYCCC